MLIPCFVIQVVYPAYYGRIFINMLQYFALETAVYFPVGSLFKSCNIADMLKMEGMETSLLNKADTLSLGYTHMKCLVDVNIRVDASKLSSGIALHV